MYATELDVLGFNKYWNYDKQTDLPYMWAEANAYYYRGQLVAKLKGGNLYNAPEIVIPTDESGNPVTPEPNGNLLRTVDIEGMISKNRDILEIIEDTTVKKIIAVYKKYKDKLDIFHVAFSGGKDSLVLLDLVKKTLPHGSFVVVFGDTGMEFPDTYDVIEKTHRECEAEGIAFYKAESHLSPKDSWEMFGPPSRTLRWCCSVHKSAPQTLKLRYVTKKNDFIGLDFVGVRAQESINRSKYEYENYGKKQKGQYSHNSILEWTSAEIWLYIYANEIMINETYKKGNARAGCLFCPMSGGTPDYLRRSSYQREVDTFVDIVKDQHNGDKKRKDELNSYVINGGWSARKNGRDLTDNLFRCKERTSHGFLNIEVISPHSNWSEWIKTLGEVTGENSHYVLLFEGKTVDFSLKPTKEGYVVSISEPLLRDMPSFGKLFRQVFRKAAYCKACKVCEGNCRNACISFDESNRINIKNCIHCYECHSIENGCLMFLSLRHPYEGEKTMKSLNSFADHAPKIDWLIQYFDRKEAFFAEHSLGPMQIQKFKRFLKDSKLMDKNHFSPFADLVVNLGWESDVAQGLILTNLVNENPQIEWYVRTLDVGRRYPRQNIEDMLTAITVKEKDAKSIVKSYKRLTEIPLGTKLNFGHVTDEGDLVRTTCNLSDPRVILFALYKFAEKCNDYKEFTLTTLLNDTIDRDGISPTRIFGLDREAMTPILLGLTAKYPEFINATFTNDLDKITLKEDKNSADVLGLF
ncbi:MAG TPA: phosphoadenosine phosphosulfate reductase family protein [Desulfitobacteriaceae bacterium]|nr:phosphoadenosine phosphosulfate reductase family protein [Desulfitobacteriaceae bacterium]